MNSEYKESINIFIKRFFMSSRIKRFLLFGLLWIAFECFIDKEKVLIMLTVVLIITPIVFLLTPNLLYKETKEAINNFFNSDLSNSNGLVLICNLKKIDGPTFGALHITNNKIIFEPFRENLQNEGFTFGEEEIKEVHISVAKTKNIFNNLFYKELNKVIRISYNDKTILLQTPNPELAIEKIKEIFCTG
ncbi:hypothetical protein [Sporosalibacterium faouarense]|uniref:hypothetical protein n=1 Tax=Sporosalibacterium faouarense TaxID=516123 RepID=UPI00141C501B|nr:hypothetical protein [Sporosalibacterium faouarense]MTI47931.1 hypothetical protein [Bacillota bacterium]